MSKEIRSIMDNHLVEINKAVAHISETISHYQELLASLPIHDNTRINWIDVKTINKIADQLIRASIQLKELD